MVLDKKPLAYQLAGNHKATEITREMHLHLLIDSQTEERGKIEANVSLLVTNTRNFIERWWLLTFCYYSVTNKVRMNYTNTWLFSFKTLPEFVVCSSATMHLRAVDFLQNSSLQQIHAFDNVNAAVLQSLSPLHCRIDDTSTDPVLTNSVLLQFIVENTVGVVTPAFQTACSMIILLTIF